LKLRLFLALDVNPQITAQIFVRVIALEVVASGVGVSFFSFLIGFNVVLNFCHNITSVGFRVISLFRSLLSKRYGSRGIVQAELIKGKIRGENC
jgi:hypothetical protein